MDSQMNHQQLTRRKRHRVSKGRAAILIAVMIFIGSLVGLTVYSFLNDDSSNVITSVLAHPTKDKINVLVLGVDEREDDVGRSDTAFVLTIDTVNKKATMLSIPRDSRVKIAGLGWDKLNHAYAFGGSKLSKSTVENLLGIPIDYTVIVSFKGFMRMIDAIGGITIDVEKRMYYADPYDDDGGLYINLQPGVQILNGRTAIEYVRYRDDEGDIGRVGRQQKFLKALVQELTKPQIITKLPELIQSFASAVRTDMPVREMAKYIPFAGDFAKEGLATEWVDGTPIWVQDVSYWLPDIRALRAKVANIQGVPVDNKYEQETERLASEYINSVPREFKVADSPGARYSPAVGTKSKESTKPIAATKPVASAETKTSTAHAVTNGKSSATPTTSSKDNPSSTTKNTKSGKNYVVTDN